MVRPAAHSGRRPHFCVLTAPAVLPVAEGAIPQLCPVRSYPARTGWGAPTVARGVPATPPATGRRRRLRRRALTATITEDPDIDSAAISGLRESPSEG